MEDVGVERLLRRQLEEPVDAGPWSVSDWSSAIAVDVRPGGQDRVLSMAGSPGVVPLPRPPLRARKAGPMIVDAEQPNADRVNLGFRWWLEGKPGWVDPDWYTAPIRPEVKALCRHDPGPGLFAALTALIWHVDGSCPADHSSETGIAAMGTGRPGFPCACMVVTAAAWDAMASWTAQQASGALLQAAGTEALVVERDRELCRPELVDPCREDLAAALRISPGSAYHRIDTARRVAALPAVTDLVEAGDITVTTGKLIAAELRNVREGKARQITQVVAKQVRSRPRIGLRPWGWKDIRDLIAKLKARLPEEDLIFAQTAAKADRKVWVNEQEDGMATVGARVCETDAHRIFHRLSAIAQGLDGDDDCRSTDQKRADIFVDLLLATPQAPIEGDNTDPASASGRDPGEVDVVITLDTLLGLADDPGHLQTLGPIPADVARELAADRKWRAWVTDTANGLVIATSPTTYRPGAALRRLIEAQEPHCRYPGCRRASQRGDLDHTIEWPEGKTLRHNLGPLCRRHHILKTHEGYDLTGPPDDDHATRRGKRSLSLSKGWYWTTPSGITIHDEPEPLLC